MGLPGWPDGYSKQLLRWPGWWPGCNRQWLGPFSQPSSLLTYWNIPKTRDHGECNRLRISVIWIQSTRSCPDTSPDTSGSSSWAIFDPRDHLMSEWS